MGDFGNLSNLRFALLAIGLFAAAFVGISWASKGFPVMAMRAAPMKPDARLPTFEQSVQQGQRKDWEQSKTSQGDNDPGRNQMRQTAIQAANAYALSPCDKTIKAAFVVATATYIKAMTGKMGCFGFVCTGSDKAEKGAEAFSTPMDKRVREAIQAAFDAGGVTKSDFPTGTQLWVVSIAQSDGDPASPCAVGKQAEKAR